MIHIAICDDEKYMLDEIENMVSKFFRNKKIEITILKFLSGRELLECKKTIDVVFLDIQMEEIGGMATAKVLRNQNYRGFLIFITILHQYVDEAKDRYEKTTSFRHDIKNHITVIKGLLEHNKMEQALNYIYDMDNKSIEMSFLCHTNNPTLDILIENKLGIAKSEGIEVLCSLVLPSSCFINDIDFCIILSNVLDNSLHACRKIPENRKRYIELSGYIQGDFILMEIKNSFDGKKISRIGIGLSNIKTVAEKYNGTMSYEIQDKTFVLSILLVIPQQSKDISQQTNERPTIMNR